jgi:hypothetical protein
MQHRLRPALVLALATLLVLSCRRQDDSQNPAGMLNESFRTGSPETQSQITAASSHLQSGDYRSAALALAPVVSQQQLTEAQRAAVSAALVQMNQAVATDPKLNTRDMYEARAKMFQALQKESGF